MIDPPEDEVSGGPNHGYSLKMARENFRRHGHMYELGRATSYLENPGQGRHDLMGYVFAILEGSRQPDQVELDRLIANDREDRTWPDSTSDETASVSEGDMLGALLGKSEG